MKVLHVIPSISPLRGGPSAALALMTQSLARAGVDVHVVTTDDNGSGRMAVPLDAPVVEGGVVTRFLPRQTRFYTFSWPLMRWLGHHVRDYDLVHIHALFSYPSLPAAFHARRCRVPYIVRPLGTLNQWGMRHRRRWLKQASFHLIERRILAGASAVHYTSEQERIEACRLGAAGNTVVAPLGVDLTDRDTPASPTAFLRAHPSLRRRTVILFLSRLDRKKGVELLLAAFARVHQAQPHAALVIAGSGEATYTAELCALAHRLGIADSVVWPGFLVGDEKLAALSCASVFVLPSHSENFGVAPVEAMAAGLPVIVSDQVGVSRDVEEARAGIVVRTEAEELADAILRLVCDPVLRRWLGENGKRLARDRFSIQATTRRLIQLYEEVLQARGQKVCR